MPSIIIYPPRRALIEGRGESHAVTPLLGVPQATNNPPHLQNNAKMVFIYKEDGVRESMVTALEVMPG